MPQQTSTSRRQFISSAAFSSTAMIAGAGGLASTQSSLDAAEAFARKGGPRFQIGLAAYSLRNYFSFMKGKEKKPADLEKAIDMIGFLDYCVAQGFQAAELTSYFFKPDADDAYFLELKRQAFLKGVTISGTAIGNNFTRGAGDKLDQEIDSAIKWIDHAAVLGAPHIRFFAGTGKELDEHPERFDEAVEAMKRCADHAAKRGVFLGIENHGNLRAEQLLSLIEAIDHPWVGINLDTGNFFTDDPYGDLQRCVPYAVNVQVKVSMRRPDRSKYPADLPRVGKILKDAGYQGFVVLEYEDEAPYENIPDAHRKLREALV
ncbi:sugar phosphate isomerase/epimerase family protein [Roseiconus lacunae]|uniref:sugar phosphate isomerase/epimerase family protein n=1 Tax=Roseiconus lacunae TaxID=2605694 RepID=UPI00308A4E6F|nr:sugar phosphate isomerase/epimerase family protein [Stieleria sp. HD01]